MRTVSSKIDFSLKARASVIRSGGFMGGEHSGPPYRIRAGKEQGGRAACGHEAVDVELVGWASL